MTFGEKIKEARKAAGLSQERHIGEEVITDTASFINAEEENTDGIEEN